MQHKADRLIVSYPLYAKLVATETGFPAYCLDFHHDRSYYLG